MQIPWHFIRISLLEHRCYCTFRSTCQLETLLQTSRKKMMSVNYYFSCKLWYHWTSWFILSPGLDLYCAWTCMYSADLRYFVLFAVLLYQRWRWTTSNRGLTPDAWMPTFKFPCNLGLHTFLVKLVWRECPMSYM